MEILTYPMDECGNKPLYKYIYECIRNDILSGKIRKGERLPSKRSLASNLGVSVITVENAYYLLETEGFIQAIEKRGYFVSEEGFPEFSESISEAQADRTGEEEQSSEKKESVNYVDLSVSNMDADSFPFDTWAKLSRRILLDREESFLKAPMGCGVPELRKALSVYLYEVKGIKAPADRIIIGPGTEYLHHILIQLLGRNNLVAVEDPGYKKVGKIYESNGVKVLHIPVDEEGMVTECLPGSGAKLIAVSPSHHFPTGCVMSQERRRNLLSWAAEHDAYIIEDDYDSEFRFEGKPVPTIFSKNSERVIYMNTFTRSLSPSVRIAYMVLPRGLMDKYNEKLDFYSGTVSSFDQYTLAAFISEGYYERHIRRMRNRYKKSRDNLLRAISDSGLERYVNVLSPGAGPHLIIEIRSGFKKNFIKLLEDKYIKIAPVELYCYSNALKYRNKYLISYGDFDRKVLLETMTKIREVLENITS